MRAAALLLVGALAGCAGVPATTGVPAAPAATPVAPTDGTLVVSEATLPQEPGDPFADIATSPQDAERAWRRFGLSGRPPDVEVGVDALLFAGFGESGSCPARFDRLVTDGARVEVRVAAAAGACTDDHRPRTLVVAAPAADLPDGGFALVVDGAALPLAAVTAAEPPSGATVVRVLSAERPRLRVSVSGGPGPVEVVLSNDGDVSAGTGGWATRLVRWDGQRWLPAPGQPLLQDHPAVEAPPVEVEPGRSGRVAVVRTETLDAGWYAVVATLQLGGRGGAAVVQGVFEVGR